MGLEVSRDSDCSVDWEVVLLQRGWKCDAEGERWWRGTASVTYTFTEAVEMEESRDSE